MKMLKITPCLLALLLILQNICLAHPSISDKQAVLGWVTIFDTKEKVEEIYGKPKSITDTYNHFCEAYVTVYDYGNSFEITFNKDTNKVCLISTREPNGIKLSNGITVGSSMYDVERKLGRRYDNTMAIYKPYPLCYHAHVSLKLGFDKNGKVSDIILCHFDVNK